MLVGVAFLIPALRNIDITSVDIITRSKSQGLYIKKIKYWNASESGFPSSLISAILNKGILQ